MKFIIRSAQGCFNEEGKKAFEPLGFRFRLDEDSDSPVYWINDAEDVEVEVSDIAGLLALCEAHGPIIVRKGDILTGGLPVLLIYNDYIE